MNINGAAIAYDNRHYTVKEYLDMESESDIKHQFYKGEIFAMAGTKSQHIIVSGNLYAILWQKLKSSPCRPCGSDTRIYIEKNTLFTYPDISVICGQMISLNNDDFNFMNPTIIIEVLSESTKDYDRNQKFEFYKDIPTLREYILVDPDTINIEAYYLTKDGNWQLKIYNSLDDVLRLYSVLASVELKDIYEGTKILLG